MHTSHYLDLLQRIEDSIHTTRGCFRRYENGIRISYRVGRQFRYIVLATRKDAAVFLKKHRIIDQVGYSTSGDLFMYQKAMVTVADHRGRPVMGETMVKVAWDQIELNPSQVARIAAKHEFDVSSIMLNNNDQLTTAA